MTDTDSNKVIEKLTEVLELLKAEKEPKKEPKKEDTKCVDEKCVDENCVDDKPKCPFRKVMSEKEFDEFCKMAENLKKEDFVKVCSKGDCGACPFMAKKTNVPQDNVHVFEEQRVCQESKECIQVINTVLSLVLLVLFCLFLFRSIKGFYSSV